MNRTIAMLAPILGAMLFTFFSWAWSAEKPDVFQATVGKSGVQKIEMTAGNYYFKPNDVVVRKNVPVEIVIRKEPGSGSHSLVMHSAGAGIDFEVELSNEPQTIKFTPTKTGKYPFYCDEGFVVSHRSKGMEGVLEVTE